MSKKEIPIMPLIWKTERIWSELFCGNKKLAFAKPSSDAHIRPFVWFSHVSQDTGFADSLEDAKTQAEDSFKKFVSEILV